MLRKILVAAATTTAIISTLWITNAWTQGVKCSSDPVFAENSCNQCFVETKLVKQGDAIANLKDAWVNNTSNKLLMLKNEQKLPEMKDLSGGKTIIEKKTINGKFWITPNSLKNIYDNELEGYLLEPGKSVDWTALTLWAAYKVEKNTAPKNSKVALLKYVIKAHSINGENIDTDWTEHAECVLYKSAGWVVAPKTNKPNIVTKTSIKHATKQKTGPEMYILVLLAILMGAFFIRKRA